MKLLLRSAIAILALLAPSLASPQTPEPSAARTIQVTGHSELLVNPDTAIVTLEVETKASDGESCARLNAEATRRVVDAVKEKTADHGRIETSGYSINSGNEPTPGETIEQRLLVRREVDRAIERHGFAGYGLRRGDRTRRNPGG